MRRGGTNSCVLIILLTVFAVAVGCSNALNYEVASLTDQQRIRVQNALTADQLKRLDDWIERSATANKQVPRGVTVKQALIDQDNWLAKRKLEAARAEELKRRVQAERAAKQERIAKMLSVTLLSKKNKVQVDERKYVALEIAYDNRTKKDIRRVVGVLRITDIYGNTVMDISSSYGAGISAQQTTVDHDAGVFIDKSVESEVKLWNTDFDKLKFTFEADAIIFKDGTSTQDPEGGA